MVGLVMVASMSSGSVLSDSGSVCVARYSVATGRGNRAL
ncbi:hypothetical protein NSERUTF1_3359 [Nocardia seriolae]|nr:hypothetical protein NSERUTF1_3359 [Nocardia seriolae]